MTDEEMVQREALERRFEGRKRPFREELIIEIYGYVPDFLQRDADRRGGFEADGQTVGEGSMVPSGIVDHPLRCEGIKANGEQCKCWGIMLVNEVPYCKQHAEKELSAIASEANTMNGGTEKNRRSM